MTPSPTSTVPSVAMGVSLDIQGKLIEVNVNEGATAYDLLVAAQKEGSITFAGREFSGVGFFVESINGLKQDGNKRMYWIYSVNGKKANVGASSYVLRDGDRVTWSYEQAED